MVAFDITYVHPSFGVITARQCSSKQLKENKQGEVVFMYNDHYPSCKVIECIPVRAITPNMVTMNGRFSCE